MTLLSHLWTSLKYCYFFQLAFFTYLIIKDSMKSLNEYSISNDNIIPDETKGFARIYRV